MACIRRRCSQTNTDRRWSTQFIEEVLSFTHCTAGRLLIASYTSTIARTSRFQEPIFFFLSSYHVHSRLDRTLIIPIQSFKVKNLQVSSFLFRTLSFLLSLFPSFLPLLEGGEVFWHRAACRERSQARRVPA